MAHFISGRDQQKVKLRAFHMVPKGEACTWYEGISAQRRGVHATLVLAFETNFANP